jgi:uncharacterized protein (DUF1501 family)
MKRQSRRDFLSQSTSILAVGGAAPLFWKKTARATEPRRDSTILIVLELTGGNDGLNTVVPFADDVYQKNRPVLRVEPAKVLKLDDHVGLHPSLKALKQLWDKGHLAVIQGVGYPHPDRSHFRSMEIWQSGTIAPPSMVGWLGRVGDTHPGTDLCHVGQESVPLAVQGRKTVTQSLASVADYRLANGAELPSRFPGSSPANSALEQIRRRYSGAAELSRKLEKLSVQSAEQPGPSTLEGRLATIGSLIRADTSFRVYYTSLGGFDTHVGQLYTHSQLLQTVAKAVTDFLENLRSKDLADRVVVLVFSEFGRRLTENASAGTDHGTAAPVLIAGSPVRGGLLGKSPSLTDLDETGDPRFTVDFRDVYASLLEQWLHIDPLPILGRSDGNLPLL